MDKQFGKHLDEWLRKHQSAYFTIGKLLPFNKSIRKFTKLQDAIKYIEDDHFNWVISAIYNSNDEIIMLYYDGKWFSLC